MMFVDQCCIVSEASLVLIQFVVFVVSFFGIMIILKKEHISQSLLKLLYLIILLCLGFLYVHLFIDD